MVCKAAVVSFAMALAAPAAPAVAWAASTASPETVRASPIARQHGTLPRGSRVPSRNLFGQRVFIDGRHGFALAEVRSAQYPAATADGGRTWRTDGPALHLDAAQAPLAVADIGAAGRKTAFAWGGGQVVDTTGDGGRHWYRAVFQGTPTAVVGGGHGRLVAFVDGEGPSGATRQYVSSDGGRTWRRSGHAAR